MSPCLTAPFNGVHHRLKLSRKINANHSAIDLSLLKFHAHQGSVVDQSDLLSALLAEDGSGARQPVEINLVNRATSRAI